MKLKIKLVFFQGHPRSFQGHQVHQKISFPNLTIHTKYEPPIMKTKENDPPTGAYSQF